jgi:hypothetical protein
MSFDEFTLLPAIPKKPDDPVVLRRERLATNVSRQISLLADNTTTKSRRGAWYREIGDGKIAICLRYGKVDLELAKGKFAASCNNRSEAAAFLKAALIDIEAGKFDQKLDEAAASIRERLQRFRTPT